MAAAAVALLAGCAESGTGGGEGGEQLAPPTSMTRPDEREPAQRMQLESPAFEGGEAIPERFTCDGEGLSPPLRWRGVPERAQELALTVVDTDADGSFVHWIVTGIPVGTRELPEGGPLPAGAVEAGNDAGSMEWTGPCPPEGESHTYTFTLYALHEEPVLEGSPEADVAAVQGASSSRVELTGTYSR